MNISNGVDRVGKVIFWISFLVNMVIGVVLMNAGGDYKDYGFGILWTTVLVSYALSGLRRYQIMMVWYILYISALVMNKFAHAAPSEQSLIYIGPLVVFGVIYLIAKYIIKGFTAK